VRLCEFSDYLCPFKLFFSCLAFGCLPVVRASKLNWHFRFGKCQLGGCVRFKGLGKTMFDNQLEEHSSPALLVMAESHIPPFTNYGGPVADRPQHLHFEEPPRPYHSTSTDTLRLFQSSTNLSVAETDNYHDEEYIDEQPLDPGQSFTGGFYPPGHVPLLNFFFFYASHWRHADHWTPIHLGIHVPRVALHPCLRLPPPALEVRGGGVKPSHEVSFARSSSPRAISLLNIRCRPQSMLA
jgi:hypothetical protein